MQLDSPKKKKKQRIRRLAKRSLMEFYVDMPPKIKANKPLSQNIHEKDVFSSPHVTYIIMQKELANKAKHSSK
jgi:hypothetical protein